MYKALEELGFKEGDKIRCVESDILEYVKGEVYVVGRGAFAHLSLRNESGQYIGTGYSADWELVAPEIDMSDNRVPFGLLTEEEQKALKGWDGVIAAYQTTGNWINTLSPRWGTAITYRTVPKPIPVSDLKGTVKMKDGKPDWSTYSED